jgi:hypothetical protein
MDFFLEMIFQGLVLLRNSRHGGGWRLLRWAHPWPRMKHGGGHCLILRGSLVRAASGVDSDGGQWADQPRLRASGDVQRQGVADCRRVCQVDQA